MALSRNGTPCASECVSIIILVLIGNSVSILAFQMALHGGVNNYLKHGRLKNTNLKNGLFPEPGEVRAAPSRNGTPPKHPLGGSGYLIDCWYHSQLKFIKVCLLGFKMVALSVFQIISVVVLMIQA